MTHEIYMRAAIAEAKNGIETSQTPFGACIVAGDKILTAAHNAVWAGCDITAHAEILAIRQACTQLQTIHLNNCIIVSTCEPCPMCFSAIHWARIPRIVYGASIDDAAEFGFNEIHISNNRLQSMGDLDIELVDGVLRDECRELFRIWQDTAASSSY